MGTCQVDPPGLRWRSRSRRRRNCLIHSVQGVPRSPGKFARTRRSTLVCPINTLNTYCRFKTNTCSNRQTLASQTPRVHLLTPSPHLLETSPHLRHDTSHLDNTCSCSHLVTPHSRLAHTSSHVAHSTPTHSTDIADLSTSARKKPTSKSFGIVVIGIALSLACVMEMELPRVCSAVAPGVGDKGRRQGDMGRQEGRAGRKSFSLLPHGTGVQGARFTTIHDTPPWRHPRD